MRVGTVFLFFLLIFTSCSDETRRFQQYAIHGVDVSHYQSHIDWQRVVDQDFHFAFIKATEGETFQDTMFARNWDALQAVALKRGAYHFFRPTISATHQAENFADLVALETGDLPPVLDVEVMDGVSKIELINGIRTWLYLTEIKFGIKPIIYTNLKFYYKNLAGHFDDYPIWIARYSFWKPRLADEKEWKFWQYGNRGRIAGINGDVDFNVFNGSLEELERLCFVEPRALSLK
ncbi:MAG: glycoside hydrolase family 25 protein [Phaeodactylibacter sp.]|nr:glycoside hydrolase family 25 protein [Phaeodactylibacter sp.]